MQGQYSMVAFRFNYPIVCHNHQISTTNEGHIPMKVTLINFIKFWYKGSGQRLRLKGKRNYYIVFHDFPSVNTGSVNQSIETKYA